MGIKVMLPFITNGKNVWCPIANIIFGISTRARHSIEIIIIVAHVGKIVNHLQGCNDPEPGKFYE